MPFFVLVDYDNLATRDKSQTLVYVTDKILNILSPAEVTQKNVTVRLYGGWYENNNMTRKAQNLSAEIGGAFPKTTTLSDNKATAVVSVELALSLQIAPADFLYNTFRRHGYPAGLMAHDPVARGCHHPVCPISEVYKFLQQNYCHVCRTVRPEDIIYRQEQKLVDTMLTSDMIFLGNSEKAFCLVSSDDDFWPGIYTSLIGGATVYHIHTKLRATPRHYTKSNRANYLQKQL